MAKVPKNIDPSKPLTPKQRAMADHFLIHGSKTEAYRHAYNVSPKQKPTYIANAANQMFRHPNVARYVAERQQEQHQQNIVTREEALMILSDIARGKISNFLNEFGEIDPAKVVASGYSLEVYEIIDATETAGGRRKIKIRSPIQAIERLAKMQGWDEVQKLDLGGVTFQLNLAGDQS